MNLPFELLRLLTLCGLLMLPGCGNEEAGAPGAGAEGTPAVQESPGTAGAQDAQQQPQPVDLSSVGFDEGDPEAVVRVIEFSDFGCVHCATFHLEAYGPLHDEFIEEGDVIWKYIPITIGGFPNGDAAAIAGQCAAEQGEFAAMRDRLFETREEWMGSDDAEGMLVREAGALGLDEDAFRTCLSESEEARGEIAENDRIAIQIGVRATPTFLVQGHPVEGAPPLSAFQEVLRELVAEARDPAR